MKYLIFNLKSKLNYQELDSYIKALEPFKKDIIIAPSFLYLEHFKNKDFQIAAQDVSAYPMGNYTGEVNATQLSSIGCKYVLVGHYERRKYLKEDFKTIISKIKEATQNQIKVVLCLSSSLDNLKKEIKEIFSQLHKEEMQNIIIAYEPSLMIGTNKEIKILKLQEEIASIKKYIFTNYQINIEIIYGGSVNLSNLNKANKLNVDGLLIGEVSTQLDEVLTLIKEMRH